MNAWTEVNISTQAPNAIPAVLKDLVAEFRPLTEQWHLFVEPSAVFEGMELRLRFCWRVCEANRFEPRMGELFDDLWYRGCHGRIGESYTGEADQYGGAEMWPLVVAHWTTMSDLTLTAADSPKDWREYYWSRMAHLVANQLVLDDVEVCLRQAVGYMQMRPVGGGDAGERDALVDAINEYLESR